MILDAGVYLQNAPDAAQALRNAIDDAVRLGVHTLHIPAGRYELHSTVHFETASIAHDDGCGDIREKDSHLLLEGCTDLCIEGDVNADGSPASWLVGVHDGGIQQRIPAMLWAQNCPGLCLKNLAFTRVPETSFAGRIVDIVDDCITVQLPEGREVPAETGAYCMNRFDWEKRVLVGESLTVGFGYDRRFHRNAENFLVLQDAQLAAKLRVGEGLSWHMSGLTDFSLFFGSCDNLELINLRVACTNAFAMLTENCRTIHADRLELRPAKDLFFTGPRDGWKVYRCGGDILVENSHFEGFRMDAQNVHSNYLQMEKRLDERRYIFTCKYAPIRLRSGTALRVQDEKGREWATTIVDWRSLPGYMQQPRQTGGSGAAQVVGHANHISRYEISLQEELPEALLCEGILAEALCWEPDSYVCRNTLFRNIAGAGHLLRCRNVLLENNHYENLMNAGVLIGAEKDTHCESAHGADIIIRGCSFENIGFKPRYGRDGCAAVAVKSEGFHAPLNRCITIEDNVFHNCDTAIELHDAAGVWVRRNRYNNVRRRCTVEEETVNNLLTEEEEP